MFGLKRILCPTDLSEESFKAFPYAFDLARIFDAEIYFVHVVNVTVTPTAALGFEPTFRKFVSAVLKDATGRMDDVLSSRVPGDAKFRRIVVHGSAAEQILQAADDHKADLVVIATHGLTGWRHMVFGSVAEKVVRQAKVPVLTVSARPVATNTEKEHEQEVFY